VQLVINTRGSYLRKRNDCFVVKKEDRVFEISAKKVDSIMITTSAYISTDAIKFAMENNIDLIFLDEFGDPYGRVWHSKLGSTVLIRRKQLEISIQNKGLELAKTWLVTKVENQIDFLKRLKNSRPKKEERLDSYINQLKDIKNKLSWLKGTIEEKRGKIMALEGLAGKIYFGALSFIMPDRFKFDGRSRAPAKDEFNCLLNYGYGVLYSLVEKGCIIAGLDPYVGFVHTDNYNKKSLVFDLIEMFRIFVDEAVVHLVSQRKVKREFFDKVRGGLTLNKEGKALLIEALNERLEKNLRYRGRNVKRKNIIQLACHRIASSLIKESQC